MKIGTMIVTVMTLAGLAILKRALDALDQPLGEIADADLAVEFDGFVTVFPIINEGRK